MSRNQKQQSPECGHCKNIGLDYKHNLRGLNGTQIICRVLLNTECSNCHKFGHTKGKCNKLNTMQLSKWFLLHFI